MTSRKVDMSIPNTPFPTRARGLVLGANGKLETSVLPDGVITTGSPAGGVLAGTYPNPTFAVDMATQAELDAAVGSVTTGLGNKVDKDSVVVAATRIVQSKLLAGDTQPAFKISGDGKIEWGPGGSTALTTSLSRRVDGWIQTPGTFSCGGEFYAGWPGPQAVSYSGGKFLFADTAGTYDTNLYRLAAGVLKTDGQFRTTNEILGPIGPANESGVRFLDTNLYRLGANHVKTDGYLSVGVDVYAARHLVVDIDSSGDGRLYLSGAFDASLYRAGAGVLRTDGRFTVGQDPGGLSLHLNPPGGGYPVWLSVASEAQPRFRFNQNAIMEWGPGGASAPDTNLYRSAAIDLRTNADFSARPNEIGWVVMGGRGPGGVAGLQFGQALDTNLYRYAPNFLATSGQLWVGWNTSPGSSYVASVASGDGWPRVGLLNNGSIQFGPGNAGVDTNLYRMSGLNQLKTDNAFNSADTIRSSQGLANQIQLHADGHIYLGVNADTNLYRSSAGVLKTDGQMVVGHMWVSNNLYIRPTAGAVGGAQANKLAVYDQSNGAFLGYVPIYAT